MASTRASYSRMMTKRKIYLLPGKTYGFCPYGNGSSYKGTRTDLIFLTTPSPPSLSKGSPYTPIKYPPYPLFIRPFAISSNCFRSMNPFWYAISSMHPILSPVRSW